LILYIFLLLKQLIFGFIVVPKKQHFIVDQSLECVSLETHITEKI